MNFKQFKAQFQKSLPDTSVALYQVDVPKEMLWDTFINSFPEELRSEYTCNCCKSFVRAYGGLVSLKDYVTKSIWEVQDLNDPIFKKVANQMAFLVKNEPIRDVFVTETRKLGTNNNSARITDDSFIVWEHMFIELSAQYPFIVKEEDVATKRGDLNSTGRVFVRALEEITIDSLETVLDLISQNSLYKGEENEDFVKQFLSFKKEYVQLTTQQKIGFGWEKSTKIGEALSRFKNTSIGGLALAISEGEDLDAAVGKYESKVAPENYKRPQAIFTKKQVEAAEKTISDLGLTESLGRRFAHKDDISVEHVLFVDNTSVTTGIFAELKEEATINPKTLSKIEEVGVKDFIEKILPKVTGVEILVENDHSNNFVSLIAAQHPEAPSLFKWNNPFSWSYRNALADSGMKEKVKTAGGNVEGILRFSIQWNDEDTKYPYDFDAHAFEPNGTHIYYSSYRGYSRTSMGGNLDVDMTGGPHVMVENITWLNKRDMQSGNYRFEIRNFTGRPCNGFKAQIEMDGELYEFFYPKSFLKEIAVATVTLKDGVFSIKSNIESSSSVISKEVWGIGTMRFHKVNLITQSPNYWGENAVGNRHLFFMIDKVHNNESVRGFFNEYLKPELDVHRKVFEALGGRLKVEPSEVQVSGLGYSSTKKDSVIVKLTGSFTRTIKIKF